MNLRNIPIYQPKNYYNEDPFFQKLIAHYLPAQELTWAEDYLRRMGEMSAKTITALAVKADLKRPEHVPYDAEGNRIDKVEYDASYTQMARLTYEFGIVGLGYSKTFREAKHPYSPLLKFALGYLFSQSGSVLYCPICMTDGTLQVLKKHASPAIQDKWIPRITSMEFESFYDGAMYLTEGQGGSDVGTNTCEAYQEDGQWKLKGEKWFCSNLGSKTALVLARPRGAVEGTRGLGMFLLPLTLEDGSPNHIFVRKIKNKLGTCEMATGEVEFEGSVAYLIGEINKGFAYMTDMLNLSRTYNAIWSIGLMRRAYLEANHYAKGRLAFGKTIQDWPLVNRTLEQMEIDCQKASCLVFEAIHYGDKVERGLYSPKEAALSRMLTPVIKFYTAEKAIESSHRAIEIFGGNGCIEDFPVAKILRDAQILSIWEGTANILSLDLLRVLKKEQAHVSFFAATEKKLNALKKDPLELKTRTENLKIEITNLLEGKDGYGGQLACREVAWKLAEFLQDLTWTQVEKTAH